MKKLLLLALSFGLLASCAKDDKNGIPPVDPKKPQPEKPQEKPATALEVKDLKAADYEKFRDSKEKVKLHGEIVIERNKSYFKFSDNTLIQIYASKKVYDALSKDAKAKLQIAGQEVTITGKFEDFTPNNGDTVREIVYEKESDLVFGKTPEAKPEQPVVTLEASRATVNDYKEGEVVKIHGNITVQTEGKYKKSYFKFSDGTLIQFYVKGYTDLSQVVRTKLETDGQEVTVKGTFNTHTITDKKTGAKTEVRQIKYESASDLTFN